MYQRIVVSGSVALLALLTAGMQPADAKSCKASYVSATGKTVLTAIGARASARWAWRSKVRARFGKQWDTWMRSTDQTYTCVKSGIYDKCTAKARPCS